MNTESDRGRVIDRNHWRFRLAYRIGTIGWHVGSLARHIDSDGAMCVITDDIERRIKELAKK